MRFSTEQRYPAPVDAVLALYTDESFYARLTGSSVIDPPEVIDRTENGDAVRMRIRYRFIADLPGPALAIIDPRRLTWIDETTFDLANHTSRTVLHPDHYPDRLKASAIATYKSTPDGGTVRHTNGELKVRVTFVGGQAEKAIISGLVEHFADEARLAGDVLSK